MLKAKKRDNSLSASPTQYPKMFLLIGGSLKQNEGIASYEDKTP